MTHARPAPTLSFPVFRAQDVLGKFGANMGDPLSHAAELVLDDIYQLPFDACTERLSLSALSATRFEISPDTELGRPGGTVHLDAALTFMSPDGAMHDAFVLVEVEETGDIEQIYLLPLTVIDSGVPYQLMRLDTDSAAERFAQIACVSFARGTRIALATGEQRAIEDLKVGDPVLTRDDGVQRIRWIGATTLRAVGEYAPIRISAGVLNNENDLTLSPDHRLFIYQRSDEVGAGRAELLVKARHLVNDTTIIRDAGGFVDYFQLLFDSHQIIYAEGIAAETMLINTRTRPVLPRDVSAALGEDIPGHTDLPHDGLDVQAALLDRPDAAEVLRRASSR